VWQGQAPGTKRLATSRREARNCALVLSSEACRVGR
jgi:hypothetical protein